MSSVDERIVKLSFDNEQFESGVKTTLNTLDKLKDKLSLSSKDTFKGLEFAINDVKFNGMASGVESLQKRFSTLGIIGMEVTKRLTNAAIDAGKKIADATIGQVKKGGMTRALDIEQAEFQLRGLGISVEMARKAADAAVTDTAYGLNEAMKAASVLGASGITTEKQMTQVLTTISGAAAMTGRSYSDIADIFATVAGNGKLMTEQLRQFSHSGLNVSAVLAEAFHKTESEINEMVSKGEISFEQFTWAMQHFGKHAKAANDTFTGSLSNLKAALSRVGQIFAEPYIKNMIPVLHALRKAVDNVKIALVPLAQYVDKHVMQVLAGHIVNIVNQLTKLTEFKVRSGSHSALGLFINGLVNILQVFRSMLEQVSVAFKEVFPRATIGNLKKVIESFHWWTDELILNKEKTDNLKNAMKQIFKILFAILRLAGTVIGTVVKGLGNIAKPFGGIVNAIATFVGFLGNLIYNVITVVTKVRILSRIFTAVTSVISVVVSAVVWLAKAIRDAIKEVLKSEPVVNLINAISYAFKSCITFISNLIGKSKELGSGLLSVVGSIAGKVITTALSIWAKYLIFIFGLIDKVRLKIKDLFAAFKQTKAFAAFTKVINAVKKAIVSFISKVKDLAKNIKSFVSSKVGALLEKFSSLASKGLLLASDAAKRFKDKIKELFMAFKESRAFSVFVNILNSAKEHISIFVDKVKELASNFIDLAGAGISKGFSKLVELLGKALSIAASAAGKLAGKIKELFAAFKNSKAFNAFVDILGKLKQILSGFADKVKEVVSSIADWFKEHQVMQKFFSILSKGLELCATAIVAVVEKIKEFATSAYDFFKDTGLLEAFVEIFHTAMDKLKDVIQDSFDNIKKFASIIESVLKPAMKSAADKAVEHGGKIKNFFAFDAIKNVLSSFIGVLTNTETKIGDFSNGSVGKITDFATKAKSKMTEFLNVFKNINFEKMIKLFPVAALGIFLMNLSKLVKTTRKVVGSISSITEACTNFINSLQGISTSIRGYFDALKERAEGGSKWQKRIKMLLAFAAAVLVLAAAVKLLGSMDAAELGQGLAAVIALMIFLTASFAVLGKVLTKMESSINFAQIGLGMLLMAASLLILSAAIKSYAKINPDDMKEGLLRVVLALAALTVAVLMMGQATANMFQVGLGLLLIVAALGLFSKVIMAYQNLKIDKVADGLKTLVLSLVLLTGAVVIMGQAQANMLTIGAGLILIVAALGMLTKVVKSFGEIDTDTLTAGLISVSVLLGVISISVLAMSQSGNLKGAGNAILRIAIALGVISLAIKLMAAVDFRNLVASFAGFVGLLLAMTFTLATLSGIDKGLGKATVSVIAVSAAISIMAIAFKQMGTIPFESIIASMGGFIVLLLTMMISLKVLSGISTGLGKAALSIIAVSAAISMIAIAVSALSGIPFESLIASFGGLIVLLIAMSVALGVLSKTGGGGLNLIATAASFIALSLGIMVLAAAVKQLAEVPVKTIVASLISFGVAMGLLAIAGVIAEAASIGLLALAAVLISVGVTLLMAALSVQMFVDALVVLNELGPEAMTRVVEAIVAFITQIGAAAPQIAQAALSLILAFIGALTTAIPALANLGLQMIVSLLAGIASHIGQIAQMAILIITGLITGIARGIGPLIQAGIMLMAAFIIGLANGIRANSELFFAAVRSLLEAVLEMVIDAFKTIAEMIPVVGDKIAKGLDKAKEGLRDTMKVDETNQMLDESLGNIENTIDQHTGPIKDKFGEMKDGMVGGLDGLGDQLGGKGSDALNQLMGSITEKIPGITDASGQIDLAALSGVENLPVEFQNRGFSSGAELAQALGSNAGSAEANSKGLADASLKPLDDAAQKAPEKGKKVTKGYADNINPNAAVKAATQVGEKSAKSLDKAKTKAGTAGKAFANAYKKGVESGKAGASTAGKSLSNQAASGTSNQGAYNTANSAGLNLGQGLINGLNAKKQAAYNAGFEVGKAAAKGEKDGAQVKSPSRIGIRTGKFLGEGLIIGINSMISPAYKAGYNIGEKASNALTDAMSRVYDVLNSEIDSSPKITPVIDLTAAKKGVGQLDSMLSNKTISTAALAGRPAVGMMGFMPANSKLDTTNNNVTNTFNITVDGAENPEAFADRLLRQVSMKTRMGMA